MRVITISDVTPIPRYDGHVWSQARIQESADPLGPWTTLETKNISPLDADPHTPAPRSFTTELAALDSGWYRIVFLDQTGDEELPTEAIHSVTPYPFSPSVNKVGSLLRARTKDTAGNELGIFTEATRPKSSEVLDLIQQAADDVVTDTDSDIPPEAMPLASSVIALGAAMRIELSYFPEQVGTANSPYDKYKDLYDQQLPRLVSAVQREEIEKEEGETAENPIQFLFPPKTVDWDRVIW